MIASAQASPIPIPIEVIFVKWPRREIVKNQYSGSSMLYQFLYLVRIRNIGKGGLPFLSPSNSKLYSYVANEEIDAIVAS
jgi:hypothetical protein